MITDGCIWWLSGVAEVRRGTSPSATAVQIWLPDVWAVLQLLTSTCKHSASFCRMVIEEKWGCAIQSAVYQVMWVLPGEDSVCDHILW